MSLVLAAIDPAGFKLRYVLASSYPPECWDLKVSVTIPGFFWFFKTGLLCVARTVLELKACLCFPSARVFTHCIISLACSTSANFAPWSPSLSYPHVLG